MLCCYNLLANKSHSLDLKGHVCLVQDPRKKKKNHIINFIFQVKMKQEKAHCTETANTISTHIISTWCFYKLCSSIQNKQAAWQHNASQTSQTMSTWISYMCNRFHELKAKLLITSPSIHTYIILPIINVQNILQPYALCSICFMLNTFSRVNAGQYQT